MRGRLIGARCDRCRGRPRGFTRHGPARRRAARAPRTGLVRCWYRGTTAASTKSSVTTFFCSFATRHTSTKRRHVKGKPKMNPFDISAAHVQEIACVLTFERRMLPTTRRNTHHADLIVHVAVGCTLISRSSILRTVIKSRASFRLPLSHTRRRAAPGACAVGVPEAVPCTVPSGRVVHRKAPYSHDASHATRLVLSRVVSFRFLT